VELMNFPGLLLQLYNITNVTGQGTMAQVIRFVQSASPFAEVSLLAIFIVTFLTLKRNFETGRAIVTASFLSVITAAIFYNYGILNEYYLILVIMVLAVSTLLMFNRQDN
jgi:hypothetical protein